MASIQDLKERIDLHDLADKLGLVRPHGRGNYKSPHHDDKNPSLSIFADGKGWKDFSDDGAGGSCVDLVMYVEGLTDVGDAVRRLHELYGIPPDPLKESNGPPRKRTLAEHVAEKCFDNTDPARTYLIEERGIDEEIVDRAIKRRSVGYNDWTSSKHPAGEPLHGGPAVAFIVRSMTPGVVRAVDTRYFDPDLNGGVKTQCVGDKYGVPYCTDRREIERAHTVVVVESPINALTVECARLKGWAALATRGTGNLDIDWRFLAGKRVIICMDNDEPNDKGHRPGQAAAWKLHEQLTALNIAAYLVDQIMWDDYGWNDINDVIQQEGATEVKRRIQKLEPWIIPGLAGQGDPEVKKVEGRSRVYLPPHDFADYWRFRAKEDFVSYIKKVEEDEEGGAPKKQFQHVCGFRIAAVTRVRISGYNAMMTGDQDTSPTTVFGVSVQTPRHGYELQRKVLTDEQLHNLYHWEKFGPIYAPQQFKRQINILERTAGLGARDIVNFVGLAWSNGTLIVNEGPDTYFQDPKKQCPYANLRFPSGPVSDARRVIEAYGATFRGNAGLQLLNWALGGALKAFLGFWPHMTIQADKNAGKSVLCKRLERTIAFKMLSAQSMQTEFRLLTSISSTTHPVGWEELSARKQDLIDKAVAMLQEAYQYAPTWRGSDMTEYIQCAPVLMAGEDVPVKGLIGKLVTINLNHGKGPLIPDDLPVFPVLEWLHWLADVPKKQVTETFEQVLDYTQQNCRASGSDASASRMIWNYAATITAWRYLSEFAGLPRNYGNVIHDILERMNEHIAETSGDREPWVWITELALSELDRNDYRYPYLYETLTSRGMVVEDREVLLIRPSHIMSHIAHTPALRDRWNALTVKSDRVYKRQLTKAGVLVMDGAKPELFERTINGRRVTYLVAIDLEELAKYGLHSSPRVA